MPALNPGLNPRSRWEELSDLDYLHKLSPEEKEFMNKFMDESVNASFSKNNKDNLIKGKKAKKEIRNRNYARRVDQYNRAKLGGRIEPIDNFTGTYDEEDELNFQIEIKHRNSDFMKKKKKEL